MEVISRYTAGDRPVNVLLPCCAMAFHTVLFLLYMTYCRFIAVQRKQVSVKFFRTYDEGSWTKQLQVLDQHFTNLCELPPLFYTVMALLYSTGNVTAISVALGWVFYGFRFAHTFVHCGTNNVIHRMMTFGGSITALVILWAQLTVALL